MTYGEILSYGKDFLKSAGIDDYDTDGWLLFAYCTNMNRNRYILHMMEEAPECILQSYEVLLKLRTHHKPLQYILGTQNFFGRDFFVNESVLIPRDDTENLVLQVLENVAENSKVLDMCTGSGCIAISLKCERPDLEVYASDISKAALEIAKLNAWYHNVDITFSLGDLFEPVKEKFDAIVSNPPYIESGEIAKLEANVREFEPKIALDGGITGLDFYERIFKDARMYLNLGGYMAVEIGCFQATSVSAIAKSNGYTDIKVVKDLSGLDRVVSARMI